MTNVITWQGRVLSITRRTATIASCDDTAVTTSLTLPARHAGLMVGDQLVLKGELSAAEILSVAPRSRVLMRAYENKTKAIASHIDHLYIVTAPPPLYNLHFIDRAIAAARSANIPVSIVLNKSDILVDNHVTDQLLAPYRKVVTATLETSALSAEGAAPLRSAIENAHDHWVLLCGISGVGKSSLLNQLVSQATRATQEVSRKTGQGRQTTTQALAHQYTRADGSSLYIVDAPGLQNFGLSHLTREEVVHGFPDFTEPSANCRFIDCRHLQERECGVTSAIAAGSIAASRYESYLNILAELERTKKY